MTRNSKPDPLPGHLIQSPPFAYLRLRLHRRWRRNLSPKMPLLQTLTPPSFFPTFPRRRTPVSASAGPAPEKRTRRRRRQQPPPSLTTKPDDPEPSSSAAAVSTMEKGLRLTFMEELMERARASDSAGVADVLYDMIAAGFSPGPRSFHGIIVSQSLAGDVGGAVSVCSSPSACCFFDMGMIDVS